MDSSPSKRRRTSPSTSIAVTAENTYFDQIPQNGGTPSKRRLSLMSPTKASLARFYPSLLPRAKSAEPPRPVSREKHASIKKHTVGEGATNRTRAYIAGAALEGLRSPTNGMENGHGLLVTPSRRSQMPGDGNESIDQDQSMMNSEIRASPPEEVRYEGTAVSDTNGGQQDPVADALDMKTIGVTTIPDSQSPQVPSTPTQRTACVPTSGMGIGEDGEPSLPSTPSQLGLEPPRERPKGLLFDSPSKRLRRKGRSTAKSSSLKSPAVIPEHSMQRQKTPVASLGPRRYIANTPKPPPRPEEVYLVQLRNRLSDLEKQLQDIEDKLLRQLLLSSWQQDRSKEGKDTAKRRKDVVQRSTKIVQLRDEVLQIEAAHSTDQGLAGVEAIDRERSSTKAATLTQRLANFLPFAIKAPPSESRPPSPKNKTVTQILDLDKLQSNSGPIQSATEPFTITTSDALLLPSTEDKSPLQRQKVTLSTPHLSLTCDLQLTANTATQEISQLDVQALSSWAEPELGSWLRQPHDKMELAALGRAFGHYWEAAQRRSQYRFSCREDFKDLVADAPSESTHSPRSYLGTQDLVLSRSNVQLKFHWSISIDDDGKVNDQSSVSPSFPPAWRQQQGPDDWGQLAKISDAFAMLVEDRGIAEAIGMICKIVFPI